MQRFFRSLFLLILLIAIAITGFFFWAKSPAVSEADLTAETSYVDAAAHTFDMATDTLTVMTYNIGYTAGMTNNLPLERTSHMFRANLDAAIAIIDQVNPDIVGFQEIDFEASRSFYVDQLEAIAQAQSFRHTVRDVNWNKRYVPFPYWPPRLQFGRVISGQAIMTHLPIFTHQRHVLDRPTDNPWHYDAFYIDRLAQVTKLQVGTQQIVVINVHLEAFDQRTREIQAERLLSLYRTYKDDYPVLLIGDFNAPTPEGLASANVPESIRSFYATDRSIDILLQEPSLREAFIDSAYTLHGTNAFTFSSAAPEVKIDHIFYNHDRIQPVEAFVPQYPRQPSDHKPFVMRFTFKQEVTTADP